ncbi:MAG: ABC transporter ATP-binding protein [SAR86 cluster bacterium]|jgi:ABC-2 type transport system ATP-binding protein|nr:ABC transporter ATP-binding protein [SAR86 cluster bacterium]MBL6822537.1 ABC transporter ATP-binding protein [SAR86 cluster bacterium]MDA8780985.1 ABC transporter ATP-binding protein [Gammaproteobacteria bacterium]
MGIIKATNLEKHYPNPENPLVTFAAVNDVSLDIEPEEIFGLLGPNGAGKTTTLEMIEGLTSIDKGNVFIDDIDVRKQPYAVKKIIGVQLQSNEYFDRLNLSDLLLLFASLYATSIDPKALLAKVNLENKIKAKPDDLSGGQKQRFSIACALVNNPKILFLDEPTTGLDPQAKRNLWNLAKTLNAEGMTIVLTTHNMEEAEYLCDRIAIMDQGSIIAQDTPQQLILDYAPEPPEIPLRGNIEDVFLALTGHGLRD